MLKPAARWLMACALGLVLAMGGARTQAQRLIRDAEIEQTLSFIATPLLQAAGLPTHRMKVLVVNDLSLNAFVTDDRHIFLHAGLILRLQDVEMLQAVIAHEVAHITSGHLTRRPFELRNAASAARLGLVLALATAAAGGSDAALGIAAGTSSIAQRNYFAHTRAEELSADRGGARYLALAGINPDAALRVLDVFRGQEAILPGRGDPYALTHPMSRDRIREIELLAKGLNTKPKFGQDQIPYWHARMLAKLGGFLNRPARTLKGPDGGGEADLMARAIALHITPDPEGSLAAIDRLIALQPGDAFYHELKGQFLLEGNRAERAVASYARAVALAPREALILAGLGRAHLAVGTKAANDAALGALERARDRDPFDPRMMIDLALAYARTGKTGMAAAVTAERYALMGRFEDAVINANRALGLLPRGSAGWLRAEDVAITAEQALKATKRRR